MKEFRRQRPGDNPTQGGEDELLEEIPTGVLPGSIDGYRSGKRMRQVVVGTIVTAVVGASVGGYLYVQHLRAQARLKAPTYNIDPEVAQRAVRELHWSNGPARLGLNREPPGVEVIVLPDREIRLAEGYNHAQVKVDVRDGRTVKLKVLTGRIKSTVTAAPPTAPEATAPESP